MISIKNLLNSYDLTKDDLLEIIELGNAIYKSPDDFSHCADGKILGTLFLSLLLELDFHLSQLC